MTIKISGRKDTYLPESGRPSEEDPLLWFLAPSPLPSPSPLRLAAAAAAAAAISWLLWVSVCCFMLPCERRQRCLLLLL